MNMDIEKLAADTLLAYLSPLVTGAAKGYSADPTQAIQYPCYITGTVSLHPVVEGAGWHNPRRAPMEILILTEAAPRVDSAGKILKTSREINSEVYSSVMSALTEYPATHNTTLLALLQAAAIPGIAFSMALVGDQTHTIETVNEQRVLASIISLETIIEPVEAVA